MQEEKIFQAPIGESAFSRDRVNILIPFHAEYSRVSALVQSIWAVTRSNPYQICLIDDASPNADFIQQFKDKPQIITVRSEKQLGFAGALQLGYESTSQPWVLFMHSDCIVQTANWMIEMGRALLEMKSIGVRMVSARSNNPGDVDPRLKASSKEQSPHIVMDGPDSFLPLYCAMCHRELFPHIGGFIKNYPYAFYEDVELAHRMRKYGYKQAICGKSWVNHTGWATIDYVCSKNLKAKKEMEKNRERCTADIAKLKGGH